MRYETPIYFQRLTEGEYDADTGNYADPTVTEEKRLASVVSTSEKRMMLIYGSIREDSRTIHLLNKYRKTFDRIRIGDKAYKVDRHIFHGTKEGYVVSEVPGTRGDADG